MRRAAAGGSLAVHWWRKGRGEVAGVFAAAGLLVLEGENAGVREEGTRRERRRRMTAVFEFRVSWAFYTHCCYYYYYYVYLFIIIIYLFFISICFLARPN